MDENITLQDAGRAISLFTALKTLAQIRGSRKEALWNNPALSIRIGSFDTGTSLKMVIRQYRPLGRAENDQMKHIFTSCDLAAQRTLIALFVEYHFNERFDGHDMDVCLTSVHVSESVTGVSAPNLSSVVKARF